MLSLCTKRIVLIRDVIWLNKIYGEYISKLEHTKAYSYILRYEHKSNQLDHLNNCAGKTKYIKTEQNVNIKQYFRGEIETKHVHKTTNTVSFKIN